MADKQTILIIEDEVPIRRFLCAGLPSEFHVVEADTGQEGLRMAATYNPDVVLLDLGLPDIDGVLLVKKIREWSDVPIIVLSARGLESDKVQALDSGANDYVTKPFGMSELVARVRATLRTRQQHLAATDEPVIEAGALRIDLVAREVRRNDVVVHLTPIEYKLLLTLARNPGKVLTHRQLLNEVWGAAYVRETQYLRVYMGQLRHKLEDDPTRPRHLVTESGVGYRFRT